MAAVVLKDGHGLDGERLYGHLRLTLPPYAWPWFLRVQVHAFADQHSFRHQLIYQADKQTNVLKVYLHETHSLLNVTTFDHMNELQFKMYSNRIFFFLLFLLYFG